MQRWDSVTEVPHSLTLSNCPELRELEIYAWYPMSPGLALISSITSTKIQRISFTKTPIRRGRIVYPETWAELDNSLCRLVDRLECGLRLEVEFRGFNEEEWWGVKGGFEGCLPRSYEKGVIRGGRGRRDHC